jgi:hypothetical protein
LLFCFCFSLEVSVYCKYVYPEILRYLAPTPLITAARALLRGLGISILDDSDSREWFHDLLLSLQAMLQPPDELFMGLLRRPALLRGLLWRDSTALGGRCLPCRTRESGSAKKSPHRSQKWTMRGLITLREITMTLKLLKALELCVRAETALNRLDGPTCEVGLRSLEGPSIPWLEFAGGSRKACLSLPLSVSALCCRYDALLPHQHSPRPKSASHPQCPPPNPAGNLVPARVGGKCSALRTRGREPLRSTSRRLGLTTNSCLGTLATGSWWARSGSCCLQDPLGCSITPGSLLGRDFLGVIPTMPPSP